jgi:endo-1,4-beta-xylanase
MKKNILPIIVSLSLLLSGNASHAQLAAGKCKFLGNVIAGSVPSDWLTYWNQVTPENSTKWGSVQSSSQTSYNWTQADIAYSFAKSNNLPFKFHNFVWGQQQPSFMSGSTLTDAQKKTAVENWIKAAAAKYPDVQYIDVVNEPLNTPATYASALGGAGSTGYDWIVWTYQKARQYFPKAKLLINEYGTENNTGLMTQYLNIVNILKAQNLIDGIGLQAHEFTLNGMSAATLKSALDKAAATGIPIYISELDISGTESNQLRDYTNLFPVMWEHPAVLGVTLWGYVETKTWKAGTGILNSDNSPRTAMTWLKTYMASAKANVTCPVVTGVEGENENMVNRDIAIYPNPFNSTITIEGAIPFSYTISDMHGNLLETGSAASANDIGSKLIPGMYVVKITSASGNKFFKIAKN